MRPWDCLEKLCCSAWNPLPRNLLVIQMYIWYVIVIRNYFLIFSRKEKFLANDPSTTSLAPIDNSRFAEMCDHLKHNSNLHVLDLSFREIGDTKLEVLLDSIKYVKVLNLKDNKLTAVGAEMIAKKLADGSFPVEDLDLSHNSLQEGSKLIVGALAANCDLKSINLENCGVHYSDFFGAMCSNTKLLNVALSERFCEGFLENFLHFLNENHSLQKISCDPFRIYSRDETQQTMDEKAKKVAHALSRNRGLVHLYCRSINLSMVSVKRSDHFFHEGLRENVSLTHFSGLSWDQAAAMKIIKENIEKREAIRKSLLTFIMIFKFRQRIFPKDLLNYLARHIWNSRQQWLHVRRKK